MKIAIAVPSRPGVSSGNSVTGARWQRRFSELGHDVVIMSVAEGEEKDLQIPSNAEVVVALHARRCAVAIERSNLEDPGRPTVVALAGTDLYRDLPDNPEAMAAIEAANHLVVLQDHGITQLATMGPSFAGKASVVHQSVEVTDLERETDPEHFTVVVLAHLRDVKAPLLAARAARLMHTNSKLRVLHAGSAHNKRWRDLAEQEMNANARYTWLGGIDQQAAADLLAGADVLACTSKLEGGANVVAEAISLGIPVVGTNIGGNRGLLGNDHPGLVEVGDHEALAAVFAVIESDSSQLAEMTQRSLDRKWMTDPAHERHQWEAVLNLL